jgi:hypothetical protein
MNMIKIGQLSPRIMRVTQTRGALHHMIECGAHFRSMTGLQPAIGIDPNLLGGWSGSRWHRHPLELAHL